MSQKTVERIIGRLLTDEALRRRFCEGPLETLSELREQGFDLTDSEIEALTETDRRVWSSAARRIHPQLQRCSLSGR